jgi:hypothetical protein
LVGSEAEYECLAVEIGRSGFIVPGLDRDRGRRGTVVSGRAMASLGFGVGGHSGLLWSKMGLEMSRLSMEGVREGRAERDWWAILPLIDSVSLENEKERLGLVL